MAKTTFNGTATKIASGLILACIIAGWGVLWTDHDDVVTLKAGNLEVMRRLDEIKLQVDRITTILLKG